MTGEHFVKLIIPRINWIGKDCFNMFKQWRRLRTTMELRGKKKELIEKYLELKRKDTDDSNEEALGVKKQVELLVWILGGNNNV